MVAKELEGVAALDQYDALRDEPLEFDRANFRAVLLGMGPALRDLIVVEVAANAIGLAVKEVDDRPEKIGEIGFEACVGEQA